MAPKTSTFQSLETMTRKPCGSRAQTWTRPSGFVKTPLWSHAPQSTDLAFPSVS